MSKFRTQFKDCGNHKGQVFKNPSRAVPDQNLSLRTLLDNHTRGKPSTVAHLQGKFFETEVPNITDLNDLQELRDQRHAEIEEAFQKVENDIKGKQLDLEEEIEKEKARTRAKKKEDEQQPEE